MAEKRGYVLVVTLLVMGALLVFTFYFLNLFFAERKITQSGEQKLIAAEAAKAGLEDALLQLKANSNWTTGFTLVRLPHAGSSYTVTFVKGVVPYSTNNSRGTGVVAGYDGIPVPPGMVHLVSVGRFGAGQAIDQALVSTVASLFTYDAFFNGTINIASGTFDSYNSQAGPYEQTVMLTGGSIGSNGSSGTVVTLSGGTKVYGGITVGTGGSEATSISVSGSASYQSFATADPIALPFKPAPTGTSLGPVSVKGSAITLAPGTYSTLDASGPSIITLQAGGTYVFTGNINLSGSSQIRLSAIDPTTTIFALGNITMAGLKIGNDSQSAASLLIYGGPNTTSIRIENGVIYGGIYAPAAAIQMSGGSAAIYGSAVGGSLAVSGGSGIHFDTTLRRVEAINPGGGGASGITVRSRW